MPSSTTLDMANGFAVRRDNTPTSGAVTAFMPTTFVHQQRMMNCRFDDILNVHQRGGGWKLDLRRDTPERFKISGKQTYT